MVTIGTVKVRRINVPPAWRSIPKRWGHSLHPMCSYLAMFPPGLPRYFIEQFTKKGDVILDPFSGRGTCPLEACVSGRIGLGVDLNPLAYLLTHAKLEPPSHDDVLARIKVLRNLYEPPDITGVPDEIRMLYNDSITLPQLVFLRTMFANWKDGIDKVDRFLLAALMGIMHGNHRKSGDTSYLSISMPNTFSMAPGYVRKYIDQHSLVKPQVDVFDRLVYKVNRLFKNQLPKRSGNAFLADARTLSSLPDRHIQSGQVKMVFTSPPYLKVVNYGTFNWIRLWMLGEDIKTIDKSLRLDDEHTLARYTDFLGDAINECAKVLRDDGLACFVIGDVEEPGRPPLKLAEYVWTQIKDTTSMNLYGIVEDRLPVSDKVTRIWGKTQGNATKIDRVLILYKQKKPRFRYGKDSDVVLSKFTT